MERTTEDMIRSIGKGNGVELPAKESVCSNDLLARLRAAKQIFLEMADLAAAKKKVKEAKQFDASAIAIDEAMELLQR